MLHQRLNFYINVQLVEISDVGEKVDNETAGHNPFTHRTHHVCYVTLNSHIYSQLDIHLESKFFLIIKIPSQLATILKILRLPFEI